MKGFHVRREAHWIIISLLLAVAGCGGDSGTNGGNDNTPTVTTDVTVGDDFFNPEDIQVLPGAMVTWTWSSNREHNLSFVDNAITDSGNRRGGTYTTAMPMATGTYNYQCTIHPTSMNGTVTVAQ